MNSTTPSLQWLLLGVAPFALGLISIAFGQILKLWWTPFQINRFFHAQGIIGPPYRFFFGNVPELAAMMLVERSKAMDPSSHDILPRVMPYYERWSNTYGQPFLYWFGTIPRLTVPDPQIIKEILSSKFGHYAKPPLKPGGGEIGGNGLATLDGEKWAHHRRIINPLFYMENLKGMSSTIASSSLEVLENWRNLLNSGQIEIDVSSELRALTATVIARMSFGSSFEEGKRIFELQNQQIRFAAESFRSVDIPGFSFLPTRTNKYRRWLRQEVKRSMIKLIEGRQQSAITGRIDGYGNDLLGVMLNANKNLKLENNCESKKPDLLTIDDIVDECKTFFFAGNETTSTLLTWTMMLLGQHEEWQERAREEVMRVCCGRKNIPNAEMLSQLKIVGMILYEALRLYPPIPYVVRHAYKPMKLGNVSLPEGTQLLIPIVALHHDKAIWGEDAHQFNPQRFVDGVAKACNSPMAFMPFTMGPRICVGQNFALLEAKITLSMILQHFTFRLSPAYKHAPVIDITLQPQHGVQIIFEQTD